MTRGSRQFESSKHFASHQTNCSGRMDEKIMHEKLSQLGLAVNSLLCDKVREIYRKLLAKLPAGSLGRSEIARPTLSIEIACKMLSMPIAHERCAQISRVAQAEYTRLLNTCKIALGVTWGGSNVDQVLSLQFNAEVVEESKRILDYYNSAYVALLPSDARCYVVLDSALYKCAAFCVAAGASKSEIKFDRAAIASIAEVTASQLTKVVESIRAVWGKRDEGHRNIASRKRPQPVQDCGSGADKENSINGYNFEPASGTVGKAATPAMKYPSRHSEVMEQLRLRNQTAMAGATALVDRTGSAVLNQTSSTGGMINGAGLNASAQVGVGGSAVAADAAALPGLGRGQVEGVAAREAYEVWREAMRARKRTKLDQ